MFITKKVTIFTIHIQRLKAFLDDGVYLLKPNCAPSSSELQKCLLIASDTHTDYLFSSFLLPSIVPFALYMEIVSKHHTYLSYIDFFMCLFLYSYRIKNIKIGSWYPIAVELIKDYRFTIQEPRGPNKPTRSTD